MTSTKHHSSSHPDETGAKKSHSTSHGETSTISEEDERGTKKSHSISHGETTTTQETGAKKSPSSSRGETTTPQQSPREISAKPLPCEETTIKPLSVLPGNVTDVLITLGDWLNNLGIHIGEIPKMKADLTENVSAYTLYVDIPGVDKSNIKVQLDSSCVVINVERREKVGQKEGEKIISFERSQEPLSRTFKLDEEIDVNKAEARYENGVLELTLPKKHVRAIKELAIQ
ncbi:MULTISPECIES: Hsp20/alpha crystallin family protein [Nitrosomonas]|uniref:HSP20 family molecular chaperone IbpA n=1 Tax=Nitrosomonas communis TaxID=44574 RepID=A0A5D3YCT4_9PROT|nr:MULTISPECIES: Hsp20/alpha crystallin family protein [Nitrosomonas]TYP88242.1 HSP20 family molecular chaperone IbpA [Nitrosomonas communis]UVS60974.1 Hsp20/alpha crystallin family protein [Nitrosomonas sp. PLL12]